MAAELRRMDDDRIARLENDVAILSERVSNWMETTTDYRKSLCGKLDHLLERLDNRPCVQHGEQLKHVGVIGNALWGLVLVLVPIIVMASVVMITIKNDVEHLKSTSYGYRGIKVVEDGKL